MLRISGILLLPMLLVGCTSIGKTHQRSLMSLYSASDELAVVSERLSRIERVMLYAGRLYDSPLADDALDVAIMIHGEPDISEKTYAENITPEIISHERGRVLQLINQKQKLSAIISENRAKLIDEATEINQLEGKYNFLYKMVITCVVGIIVACGIFVVLRVL